MYNRYVPQNDGSYRRSRMQEPAVEPHGFGSPEPHEPQKPPESSSQRQQSYHPHPSPHYDTPQGLGIGQFFRQFLPNDFGTEDLLILLLLLLITGDCQEDRNTALLTLALYLFL